MRNAENKIKKTNVYFVISIVLREIVIKSLTCNNYPLFKRTCKGGKFSRDFLIYIHAPDSLSCGESAFNKNK